MVVLSMQPAITLRLVNLLSERRCHAEPLRTKYGEIRVSTKKEGASEVLSGGRYPVHQVRDAEPHGDCAPLRTTLYRTRLPQRSKMGPVLSEAFQRTTPADTSLPGYERRNRGIRACERAFAQVSATKGLLGIVTTTIGTSHT
jgi:hypothetical protein